MLLVILALMSAPATPALAKDDGDRVKCKTEQVTGTLSGRKRICHTMKEWQMIADRAVDKAQTMYDRGFLSPSNGK